MADSAGEKTEKATPKKRKDERKKGNVLQSQDVITCLFILLTFFTLKLCGPLMYQTLADSVAYWVELSGKGFQYTADGSVAIIDGTILYMKLFYEIGKVILIVAGPVLLMAGAVTVIGTGTQTKWLFSKESLKFKFDKLNPIKGIKKLFNLKSLFEVAKSLLKLVVLSLIVYNQIKKRLPDIARLLDMDLKSGVVYIASATFSIVMQIGIVFVAVAAADFLFQMYTFEKDMKMTKQEVKEEFKNLEGDPKIKGKRRQIQMQMANARMMAAVPEADVVIRNPTHFAVAIKYDPELQSAPVVVAKGKDNVAFRIIDVAKEHDITLMENKPLARALYAGVDIDRPIPPEFYQSVAEVLAFVYELKHKSLPEPKPKAEKKGK